MTKRTAIINALVFDGHSIRKGRTVIIENDRIINFSSLSEITHAYIIDGKGSTLLPGFIDAHVQLESNTEKAPRLLRDLVLAGVTTALDMGLLHSTVREGLRSHIGIADVRFVGTFATSTGSTHSRFINSTPESVVDTPKMAVKFVEDRVTEGADYIKIVADVPGPSQEIVNTLAAEAKRHGKLSIAHAARIAAVAMAQEAKVDIITHVPLDFPLGEAEAKAMKDGGRVCVPTLIMEKTLASAGISPGLNYEVAKESVIQLHNAGVLIIVGTDSNSSYMAGVKHGASFHQELELLVEAGLSNEEVLRAGTSLPAKWFRLEAGGVIEVGKRADLILVEGNPLQDIRDAKKVSRVWLAGKEVNLNEDILRT